MLNIDFNNPDQEIDFSGIKEQEYKPLAPGVYEFTIIDITSGTSRVGDNMIIFDFLVENRTVKEFLVFPEGRPNIYEISALKLKRIFDAVRYDKPSLSSLLNKTGECETTIQEYENKSGEKRKTEKIKKFLKFKIQDSDVPPDNSIPF